MTNQLDIGVRQSMVPTASKNFSLNETISGSGKKSDKTDHQPRKLKIQKYVDEIVNDGNSGSSSRPYAAQRKQLFDNSDALFGADQKRSQSVDIIYQPTISKESKDTGVDLRNHK